MTTITILARAVEQNDAPDGVRHRDERPDGEADDARTGAYRDELDASTGRAGDPDLC